MRFTLLLWAVFFLVACVRKTNSPEEHRLLVENVLLPLEPPLAIRNQQSRAIRGLELPAGKKTDMATVRLVRAEVGNPDFPTLNFAKAIRLFLVDPQGSMILVAETRPVPPDQASILLEPVPGADLLACFQRAKLDMVLEADNTLVREEGIMLIGNFEFAYSLKP